MRDRWVVVAVVALLAVGAASVVWGGGGDLAGWAQTVRSQGPVPGPGGAEPDSSGGDGPGQIGGDGLGQTTEVGLGQSGEAGSGQGPESGSDQHHVAEPDHIAEASLNRTGEILAGSLTPEQAPIDVVPGYEPVTVEPMESLLPQRRTDVPPLWVGLDDEVYAVAGDFPGRMSVVAVDLVTNSRYEFRPRDPYLPASTFKLPVTLCILEAISRGELGWDTLVTYTEADHEPVGAGGFATASFGSQYTVRNLVDRSLISSNNVAVKMLARTLTWDGLLDCTTQIGGPVTRTEDGSTPVSAADEAAWWLHLYKTHQEHPALAEELLRPLRQATYWGRIQAGTPQSNLVTHKFGTYAGYDHDGAIIWADRPYVLVVMTYGAGQFAADQAIERIATAAWSALREANPEGF